MHRGANKTFRDSRGPFFFLSWEELLREDGGSKGRLACRLQAGYPWQSCDESVVDPEGEGQGPHSCDLPVSGVELLFLLARCPWCCSLYEAEWRVRL